MLSMTGYAYCEQESTDLTLSVEIKGYNSRFLEININLPPWLSTLETKVRSFITSCCGRGKIEISIRIRERNVPLTVNINTQAALGYYNAINSFARELGIDEKPSLSALLQLDGVLETEKKHDSERYWQLIKPLLEEAAQKFTQERMREGEHTKQDILVNLKMLESSLKTISSFIPVIEETIKNNIKTRFTEILGNQIEENRILAETASQLVKLTIAEEISRLSSHLKEFRTETEENPKPGKKLDFLCQEINREINTIGSKSTMYEVISEVVKMKEALENIREQLRNVE